jgi:hypothetical protein
MIITAHVSERDQSGEDDPDDGEEDSDGEDDMSTAGGLQELLHRANVELGSAIRTGEPGANTGNGTVRLLKLVCSHETATSEGKLQVKQNTLGYSRQFGTGILELFIDFKAAT